jgi:hypothetical protein
MEASHIEVGGTLAYQLSSRNAGQLKAR